MLPQRLARSPFIVQRALTRTYATSKHSTDTYNKEGDTTLSHDSKVSRVDTNSEGAHKPEEPIAPTEYTSATETTSKEVPYTPKGEHGESQDKRYGGLGSYEPDKTHEGGGAESSNAGGRYPEKR